MAVEVEQGVEQLVVLRLQPARGAHGLPLLHDQRVALVHGVVELDAHLAVLAPACCISSALAAGSLRTRTSTTA